jgi:hypothetical protein
MEPRLLTEVWTEDMQASYSKRASSRPCFQLFSFILLLLAANPLN